MAYHYDFTPGAERDLEGLDSHIRKRILKRLKWFADNAENVRHETLGGSQSDFFKLRVGDYRILYDLIESDQLLRIFQIDHRSNISNQVTWVENRDWRDAICRSHHWIGDVAADRFRSRLDQVAIEASRGAECAVCRGVWDCA